MNPISRPFGTHRIGAPSAELGFIFRRIFLKLRFVFLAREIIKNAFVFVTNRGFSRHRRFFFEVRHGVIAQDGEFFSFYIKKFTALLTDLRLRHIQGAQQQSEALQAKKQGRSGQKGRDMFHKTI